MLDFFLKKKNNNNMQMLIYIDGSMSIYLLVLSGHWTLIIWTLAVYMMGSFVLSEGGDVVSK